jgi:hypothetical protein
MTRKLRQRILRALSLALVGAALTAGAAQAERPDDQAGMLGVGAASASTQTAPGTIPYLSHGIGVGESQFSRQSSLGLTGGSLPTRVVAPTGVVSTDDFQWGDASAGAGATLVLILLGAGLAVSIRHRGRPALP